MGQADAVAEIREAWESVAAAWERERDYLWQVSQPVSEALVRALDPAPGDTVLELAAGIGDTGFLAAARVGESGRLISSDIAPGMLAAGRRRAQELGLGNVEFRVIDAERIDLADDLVDGVLCRWGYMLMPDPAAALWESRRVLRPGGRLAFSVWAAPDRNPWASIAGRTLVELTDAEPPEPGSPHMFALSDPGRIDELLGEVGFRESEIEEIPVLYRWRDFDEYWRYTNAVSPRFNSALGELTPARRQALREELERRLEQVVAGRDSYQLEGLCLNVLAC